MWLWDVPGLGLALGGGGAWFGEPGGAGRSQEEPGGARRTQEEPGGARRSWEETGGTRRNQEETGGARRKQEEPGGARSSQEDPRDPCQVAPVRGFVHLKRIEKNKPRRIGQRGGSLLLPNDKDSHRAIGTRLDWKSCTTPPELAKLGDGKSSCRLGGIILFLGSEGCGAFKLH